MTPRVCDVPCRNPCPLRPAETVLRILGCCGCPLAEERFFPTVHDTVVSIRARAADPDRQSTSGSTS